MSVKLSVVVPVHDGASQLAECLSALGRADFTDYECIVVDDGSSQDIRSVAERHGARFLRIDRCGGPAAARNRGAAEAHGEILVFFDADVCPHADALGRFEHHLRQHPTCTAVIGSYDDQPRDPHFVSQYKNLFHHYVHQTSHTQAWTFWTGCGAIRRDVFLAAGGFDESYRRPSIEDIELGFRLNAGGHRVDLDPGIQVTHLKRWTLATLVRTDIFDRGVPWLHLMLRQRTMPSDLNVKASDRLCVALTWVLLPLAAVALFAAPPLRLLTTGAVIVAAAALVILNLDLYRFFARQRGIVFACCALPLHWLYYAYCGLAVAIVLPAYLRNRVAR